jgi:SET family sugar efflux transporter-like MFS transporter
VVATLDLGFTAQGFAVVMMANALATAGMAVVLGHLSDRMADRRRLVLLSAVMGGLAYGLVYAVQTQWAFVVAFCLVLPMGGALMSQSLAFSRAYFDRNAPDQAVFMTSVLRTMFSAAWVVVPPVAALIAERFSPADVFGFAALGHLGCTAIFLLMLTRPEARIAPAPIAKGGRLWELLSAWQLVGIGGVLALRVALQLHLMVLPLAMLTDFNGSFRDVGVVTAVAAALEVPLMIAWGYAATRLRKEVILIGNGLLFAAYLLAVSQADSPGMVLVLQLPNAVAIAALISLTITYMQDVIKGRVGLSTALLDVVNVASSMLAAGIFGLVVSPAGYASGFVAGSIASALGAGSLLISWRKLAEPDPL